jgi:hypothetical protein
MAVLKTWAEEATGLGATLVDPEGNRLLLPVRACALREVPS